MDNSLTNDIIDGLLSDIIAIRIPDGSDEALAFLEQLSEAAPDLTWNNGSRLPNFNPRQEDFNNAHYRKNPNGGLMWESREFLEKYCPYITTFIAAEDVFNQTTDCSNLLNDLL